MTAGLPLREAPGGVELRVKVTPRAGRTGAAGVIPGPEGEPWLAVRVQAAPADGAANDALIRFLARMLGVAPSRVVLSAGATSRWKRLRVVAPPAEVRDRLAAVLAEGTGIAGRSA